MYLDLIMPRIVILLCRVHLSEYVTINMLSMSHIMI